MKALLLVICTPAYSQVYTLSGKIIDNENNPISLVNIYCKETGLTYTSNLQGFFSFSVEKEDSVTLTFSHVGFQTYTTKFSVKKSGSIKIKLQVSENQLGEIIIAENINETQNCQTPNNFTTVSGDFLQQQLSGSFANALEKIPGIQASGIGQTMSKPLIRGHSGYRIVIAKNGIKQEEQYWNEHQGLAVGLFDIDAVEIIKGPASLYYGSDAIGGVINILNTKIPSLQGSNGKVMLNAHSNNNLMGINFNFSTRKKQYFYAVSLSHQQCSDYQVPSDSFEYKPRHYATLGKSLLNTAGKQTSLSLRTGFIQPHVYSYILFGYFNDHSGFFAMSAGQELVNADTALHNRSQRDILLPSIRVEHFDVQHITNYYINKHKLNVSAGFQHNTVYEFDHIVDITGQRTEDVAKFEANNLDLQYTLSAISLNTNWHLNQTDKYQIHSGGQFQYQQNLADGFSHLLPEYQRFTAGLFTVHNYKVSNHLLFQFGIRYDRNDISIRESLNPNPLLGDSVFNHNMLKNYNGLSYSMGMIFSPHNNYVLKLNIGKSYRIPAVYELASYGIHKHNLRFEKGNASLKPEEAYQTDITAEWKSKHTKINVSPYVCFFTNYIYLTPTPDFALGTFTGQVYEYRQNASLQYGTELMFAQKMPHNLNFTLSFEFVYAMNYDTKQAIPYTPPASFIPEVFYYSSKHDLRFGIETVMVAPQHLTAINENATQGFIITNLYAGKTFFPDKYALSLSLRIQNITNAKYLNHLSYYRRLQIPEPGRNIMISLTIPFKNNQQ